MLDLPPYEVQDSSHKWRVCLFSKNLYTFSHKFNSSPLKIFLVGRLPSFWEGPFLGAMLNFQGIILVVPAGGWGELSNLYTEKPGISHLRPIFWMIFHLFWGAFSLQRSVIQLDHGWKSPGFCHLGHVQTDLHWIMKVNFYFPTTKVVMTIFPLYICRLKHASTYHLHKLEVDVSFLSYYNTDPKQTHHLIEVLCQQENAKKNRKHSVSFTESP